MALTNVNSEPIILGSGDLYLGVVNNPETANEATIEAALVNVGAISGGATLEYKPSIYELKSANRGTLLRFVTDEEVSFKSGILTWNLDNLALLAPVSQTNTASQKRVGIGGIRNLPINYLRFVHTKTDGSGNRLIVNIFKAQNTNGFSFTFDKEKEVTIDAEFKALATSAQNGNLVEIIDEIGAGLVPTVTALSFTTKAASALPTVLAVTGTEYKNTSVVFIEKAGVKTNLRTFYDSATQLTAELPSGITAGAYTVKVKTGSVESTTSVSLTIS